MPEAAALDGLVEVPRVVVKVVHGFLLVLLLPICMDFVPHKNY